MHEPKPPEPAHRGGRWLATHSACRARRRSPARPARPAPPPAQSAPTAAGPTSGGTPQRRTRTTRTHRPAAGARRGGSSKCELCARTLHLKCAGTQYTGSGTRRRCMANPKATRTRVSAPAARQAGWLHRSARSAAAYPPDQRAGRRAARPMQAPAPTAPRAAARAPAGGGAGRQVIRAWGRAARAVGAWCGHWRMPESGQGPSMRLRTARGPGAHAPGACCTRAAPSWPSPAPRRCAPGRAGKPRG